jgi:type I restriction-modification system DNA methylase subunit
VVAAKEAETAAAELLRGVRSVDRPATGRRFLILVALGMLAREAPGRGAWTAVRNQAAHYGAVQDARAALRALAARVEDRHPEFGHVFSEVLVDEVLRAGGALPEHVLRATAVIDLLRSTAQSPEAFAAWFDRALDAATEAGPMSGDIVTPRPLARLMAALADVGPSQRVLDPACGQGTLLSVARQEAADLELYGQDLDPVGVALGTVRLGILGEKAKLAVGDSLRAPSFEVGGPGFDRILCDPPLGAPLEGHTPVYFAGPFGDLGLRRSESLFVALAASLLKPGGRAAILVPHGLLFRKGPEARLRDELLRRGYVEGVVDLPPGVLAWTALSLSLLILERPKTAATDRPVTLVDSSWLKLSGKRPSERLQDVHIREILDAYLGESGNSRTLRLAPAEIDAETLSLEPKRYLTDQPEGLDLERTFARIGELDKEVAIASRRIDELFAQLTRDGKALRR